MITDAQLASATDAWHDSRAPGIHDRTTRCPACDGKGDECGVCEGSGEVVKTKGERDEDS